MRKRKKTCKPDNYRGKISTEDLALGCGPEATKGVLPVTTEPTFASKGDRIKWLRAQQFDKPYKSPLDLISLLSSRGLNITNKQDAKNALLSLSYYDLINGYKGLFYTNDRFESGISIEFIHDFRLFDLKIQNILFKYSVAVENRFKNIVSQYIAEHFGVHEELYLDEFYYSNSENPDKSKADILKSMRRAIDNVNKSNFQPLLHYVQNHNHIPPWILLKNSGFSNTIDLYSIINANAKGVISSSLLSYTAGNSSFYISLRALYTTRVLRNVIAHNYNFVTYKYDRKKGLTTDNLLTHFRGSLLPHDLNPKASLRDPYCLVMALVLMLDDAVMVGNLFRDLQIAILDTEIPKPVVKRYLEESHIPMDIAAKGEKYLDRRMQEVQKEPLDQIIKRVFHPSPDLDWID